VLKYWLVRVAAFVAPRVPWWFIYPFGRLGVRLLFALRVPARAATVANLRVILGPTASEREVERAARRVFSNAVRYYIDMFRLPATEPGDLDRHIDERGYYEYLEPAMEAGKGVVIVSAHLGSPEAPIQAMAARGRTFVALIEAVEPPRLNDFMRRLREAHGHRFLPIGVETMKEALRELRGGGTLMILSDRDIQGNGACLPLFGRPVRLPPGAFEIAARTGATIIPGFACRVDDRHWSIDILPPLELPSEGTREDRALAGLRRYAALLEERIRQDPGQWIVLDRYWKDGCGPAEAGRADS
jgi:KDO2-lipid IV(A) lauroyltransferase